MDSVSQRESFQKISGAKLWVLQHLDRGDEISSFHEKLRNLRNREVKEFGSET